MKHKDTTETKIQETVDLEKDSEKEEVKLELDFSLPSHSLYSF